MNDSKQEYINPFDDNEHQFLIIKNEEMQLSLWPTFKEVPQGWKNVFGPDSRDKVIEFIESNSSM